MRRNDFFHDKNQQFWLEARMLLPDESGVSVLFLTNNIFLQVDMLDLLKHKKTFRLGLSFPVFFLMGFFCLMSFPKSVEARIGCSYDEIMDVENMVSTETAGKYVEWVCEGIKPEQPANYHKRKASQKSGLFFDGTGTDSVHLEFGPVGIFSSNSRVLNVYYQYLMENRIALGGGLYQLDGTPAFGDLFLIGGYHFEFEGIGEFLPQLRYGPNLGFQATVPYSMRFGSYFAGAELIIGSGFSLGLQGGYTF